MGAMRQKIGHIERLKLRGRERKATKKKKERDGVSLKREESELRKKQHPEMQESLNEAEHAGIVVTK